MALYNKVWRCTSVSMVPATSEEGGEMFIVTFVPKDGYEYPFTLVVDDRKQFLVGEYYPVTVGLND